MKEDEIQKFCVFVILRKKIILFVFFMQWSFMEWQRTKPFYKKKSGYMRRIFGNQGWCEMGHRKRASHISEDKKFLCIIPLKCMWQFQRYSFLSFFSFFVVGVCGMPKSWVWRERTRPEIYLFSFAYVQIPNKIVIKAMRISMFVYP